MRMKGAYEWGLQGTILGELLEDYEGTREEYERPHLRYEGGLGQLESCIHGGAWSD